MRVRIYVVLLLFLPLLSVGQQRWENEISGEEYVSLQNTISYDYGQLISVRESIHNNTSIFKLDRNGDILWQKHLFYDNPVSPNGIKQNASGEMMIYGETDYKASLVYLDACGNLLWCREFVDPYNYYETYFNNAIFTSDGNIVASTGVVSGNSDYDIGLLSFDTAGNFLWFHPFNMLQKYPLLLSMIIDFGMNEFDGFIILSGFGYYAHPDKPNLGFLKPMYIKTDTNFYEEWLLPYGVTDSSTTDTIIGTTIGVISYENGILHGWGDKRYPIANSLLMNFDTAGNETTYYILENSSIDPTVTDNFFLDLAIRDDTTYFASVKYGNQGAGENPTGEMIIDTMCNVFNHQSHPNATMSSGLYPLEKDTISNQYYLAYNSNDNNWNIVLYKFNADLNSVPIDTASYNYDSLCDNLPIASDTIYVTDCGVIVSTPEFPSPAAYYAAKQKVDLTAYPNPVNGNMVHFKLKYTQYHSNMQLTVYDISGRPMVKKPIATGQKEAQLSVNGFSPGLYVAVVSNGKKVLGKRAFVLERSK